VTAVGSRAQIVNDRGSARIELTVQMRKQLAASRWFPLQRAPQFIGIDRDEKQSGLSEEMLAHRFSDLGRGGKVDEAIASIVVASGINPTPLGFAPG